jgi:hypothetical protein
MVKIRTGGHRLPLVRHLVHFRPGGGKAMTTRIVITAAALVSLAVLACGGGDDGGADATLSDAQAETAADDGAPDPQADGPAETGTDDVAGGDEAPDLPADALLDAVDVVAPPPDLSVRLEPGQVRAGRVAKDGDLLGGPAAQGRPGDFKLYNSKVAFIVQDAGVHSFYKRYGGMPVDADVVRPQGEPGASAFGDLFFGYDLRLFEPDAAEVVSDGTDGRAVVRFDGRDGYFPWLGSFMGDLVPPDPIGLELVYEYSLGPEDSFLTIDVIVTNARDQTLDVAMVATAFIMGDGLKSHFSGPGFETSEHLGAFPWWTGLGERVSYGFLVEGAGIDMMLNYSNIAFGTHPGLSLGPHESRTLRRWLAVTDGGLDRVEAVFRGIAADGDVGTLAGKVEAQEEALVRGVRVHVLEADGGHRTVIRAAVDGTFQAEITPGSYRLRAKADGFDPSPEVAVDVAAGAQAGASLSLPPSTPFTYAIADGDGKVLPARLTFLRDGGAKNVLPARFGEESYGFGAALVVHSGTGAGAGVLPAGTYQAWATRGVEYERDQQAVTAAGTPLDLAFTLAHVVDSGGYLSTDLHIHSKHSPDSGVPEDLRVRTALAAGLEIPVMTDHDTVHDLSPAVDAIPGAADWIRMITGSEVTTYAYGHFNAWPLTPRPGEPSNGGVEWFGIGPAALFARIREHEEHPVIVQVNHPRSAALGGYFTAVGMDLAAGLLTGPTPWADDFDAVEVFNGGCGNGDREDVRDWFELLSRGYRVSVSAGSDTHSENGIGVPRVYVPTPLAPKDFPDSDIAASYLAQSVFVSCGPFVRFEIGGRGLGETLTEAGALKAWVQVQAPTWMTLKDLRVFRNGEVAIELPEAEWGTADGAVRFEDTIDLPAPGADSWFVLEVRGGAGMWPYDGDTPYALTNPIYVDVDGNTVFDAPKGKWGSGS